MTRPTAIAEFSGPDHRRIDLLQSNAVTRDLDRLEEILAEGYAAIREAVARLAALPPDLAVPLEAEARAVRDAFVKHRLLSADCRNAIRRWLTKADLHVGSRDSNRTIARVRDLLNEAQGASDRVLDLLAAEREVRWHRTNGR